MPIEPIKKSNVSEEVFEQMKALISTGEWKAGEKIQSENDLAKTFHVSRVSIRAALGRLNALGLVVSKQGEGTFVGEATIETCMNSLLPMLIIDHTQLMDVYEFRRIVDVGSARLAAQNADSDDLEALEQNLKDMDNANRDAAECARLDVEFHFLLAKATKNSVMVKVYTVIKEILLTEQTKQHTMFGPSGGQIYHPLIFKAVKDRDGEQAARIMEEHLDKSIQKLKAAWSKETN